MTEKNQKPLKFDPRALRAKLANYAQAHGFAPNAPMGNIRAVLINGGLTGKDLNQRLEVIASLKGMLRVLEKRQRVSANQRVRIANAQRRPGAGNLHRKTPRL